MLSLPNLLRDAASDTLRAYLDMRRIPVPATFDWSAPMKRRVAELHDLVLSQTQEVSTQVFDDAQRVLAMADEGGVTALESVNGMTPALLALENDVTRMLWLLVHEHAVLDHAEQARYADDKRLGRTWAGFIGPAAATIRREKSAEDDMLAAVRALLKTPQAEIEITERSRPDADGRARLMQVTIFHEGRLNSRRAFVRGELSRVPDRPVEESVVTYEPATGTIEVIGRTRDDRLGLARLVAEHLLDAQIDGQPVRLREYRLDHLRRPYGFPRDPAHKIASVRLCRVTLWPLDTQAESIVLECHDAAMRSIWDMAAQRFGERDPFSSGYRLQEAVLRVVFESQRRRRRRTISVRIRLPQGCNLKEKTENERLIGQHYLEKWELVATV